MSTIADALLKAAGKAGNNSILKLITNVKEKRAQGRRDKKARQEKYAKEQKVSSVKEDETNTESSTATQDNNVKPKEAKVSRIRSPYRNINSRAKKLAKPEEDIPTPTPEVKTEPVKETKPVATKSKKPQYKKPIQKKAQPASASEPKEVAPVATETASEVSTPPAKVKPKGLVRRSPYRHPQRIKKPKDNTTSEPTPEN